MGKRRKKCIIIIILFFNLMLVYFPSLLYPACLSEAQKSKKFKVLASTLILSSFLSPQNFQYRAIFSPSLLSSVALCVCFAFPLCTLFLLLSLLISINPSTLSVYPQCPPFALAGLSQAKQPDLSRLLPLTSLRVRGCLPLTIPTLQGLSLQSDSVNERGKKEEIEKMCMCAPAKPASPKATRLLTS